MIPYGRDYDDDGRAIPQDPYAELATDPEPTLADRMIDASVHPTIFSACSRTSTRGP